MNQRLSTPAPVTVVMGPAGIGKTTAVAGWTSESDEPVAWVVVAGGADAATAFWPSIGAALGASTGIECPEPLDPLAPDDAALALVAHLESTLERDTILVIDDYHAAEDADLGSSTELFLDRLPDRLRVVIVSRRVPSFPLDRRRVAGDLCEIDLDDLRFSTSDARELLGLLVPDLGDPVAERIISESDGWVAALRLGALAWTSRPHDSSTIDTPIQHLDEWVFREVLGAETESLVGFLGDVAIVNRTSIALAEAISERPDAGDLLDIAQHRGLFVSRVGVQGHYAIHPAVRNALLARRGQRDLVGLTACRRRAASWLEQHGDTVEALEQWLLAGDNAEALRLLSERNVQLYDDGAAEKVGELLAKVAPDAAARDVRSLIDLAWCQLVTDVASFRENVEQATWWAAHDDGVEPVVARRLRALQAIAWLSRGDWERTERDARAALEGDRLWYDDPIVRTSWNDVARAIALSERWDDSCDQVREVTVMLRRDPTRTLVLEVTRALGLALAGRPVDALRVASGARTSSTLANLAMSSGELALAEVIAHRELGDAPDAISDLERLIISDYGPLTFVHGLAAAELTQLHLATGALAEARRVFGTLESVVTDDMTGPDGRALLGRIGTIVSIATGDHEQAERWADTIDDPFWGPVSRARVLASSDTDQAAGMLDDAVVRSPRHAVIAAMLRARTAPNRDSAAELAESAVEIARANNLLQTLASMGQYELIERIAWRLPGDWMDRLRRATAVVQPNLDTGSSLIEPLTLRERDVLRFLPSRLTLKEIASELYVSVNTLKFHLKVIYRKLGVNSRAEAAEIARSWNRVDLR